MPEIESALGNFGVIAALAIIGGLIFAECAFLFGLFVPGGDILLIASGVFAAEGQLPLAGVLLVIFIAAAAGYEVGYYIGEKTGPRVFTQRNGVLFRKDYASHARHFYTRHGNAAILLARFVGYVRTIVPLLAGIAGMQRSKFVFYNIIGSLLWTVSLVMLGYWLGSAFAEQMKHYVLPITLIGLVLFFGVMIIYTVKEKHKQ